ncbi:MAG: sugar ABC transporter permease, partial [Ruminococcus sp.]|nr:sugar ABC transporter permease [Ruminococcus sp.]
MKYIDYVQLNPFQKLGYNLKNFFVNLPANCGKVFKAIGNFFKKIFVGIGKGFAGYFTRFVKGDWATKLSYIIMGFGNIVKGQIIKGLIFLATEVFFILYMVGFGWDKIHNLGFFNNGTIGFNEEGYGINPVTGRPGRIEGDDSMKLLLYGVLTLVIIAVFLAIYVASTKSAYKAQQTKAAGEKLPGFFAEIKEFFDSKFHVTLLAFPTLTISIFTILPLLFMILIAFTNYDHSHIGKLFSWVGFETFGKVFSNTGGANMGYTFGVLVRWTLIWAVLATVLNYILGMVVALMINKKGIKLKALWRTLFVVTVAVPQFVSLLLMSQMLDVNGGAINVLLHDVLHWTPEYINFLGGDPWVARITVIVVNIWVGIPYT